MTALLGDRFLRVALAFELGLAALGLAIGRAVGIDPWLDLHPGLRGFALGAIATIPMAALLLYCDRLPIRALRRIRQLLDDLILPMLRGRSPTQLALLAFAAGLGEETLFRGLLQAGLAGRLGPTAALAVSSLAFGLAHAVTPTYAAIASLIGFYLGWLLLATGDLMVPVVAHALYDLIALIYFLRTSPGATIGPANAPPDEETT
ncbi:CPBP family intramembrane glutamic endopeptidase [Tautonia sociabilis]|uniref:CPBP family intramembrane glutamic endopeptidase n=1 Tax=Tautonia sociabilis TaxID=2080755 RepID=UPI0013155035|nr:CPBP family intramembrane glutamic endopeptidase [Tautonia sociabilis]